MQIFGDEAVDVSGVSWDVLVLNLVSGSSNPGAVGLVLLPWKVNRVVVSIVDPSLHLVGNGPGVSLLLACLFSHLLLLFDLSALHSISSGLLSS